MCRPYNKKMLVPTLCVGTPPGRSASCVKIHHNFGIARLLLLTMLIPLILSHDAQAETFTEEMKIAGWLALDNSEMTPEEYNRLSPEEKARLKKQLRQWQSLPPEKQKEIRRNMNRLNRMPPEARKIYRERLHQWKQLKPAERQRIERQLENWDNLSPAEKDRIRRRFR